MKLIYTNFLVFSMLLISACTTIDQKHGAELRPANVDRITPSSTKADVRKALGSPSTTSAFGEETWYYISNQTERGIFSDGELEEQNVLAVSFSQSGVIQNVELYGREDSKQFAFSDRITPTAGRELTVIEQLLGNVGRFNNGLPGSAGSQTARGGGRR